MTLVEPAIRTSPAKEYETLLRRWLSQPDDSVLRAAEDLGRRLSASHGVVETAALHQVALAPILSERAVEDAATVMLAAQPMQLGCLKAFEIHPDSGGTRASRATRQSEEALRHLNQRLEEKVKGIAHALHDEAGQLLASVYLNVAEIATELPHRGRLRLRELRALLDQVDDELRRLSHELRPTVLDDLGLLAACQFLAEGVSRRTGIQVTVSGDTGGRLPPDLETALYRVVQEALANATRHGHPHAITVAFDRSDGVLKGSIRDNGAGFDAPGILEQRQTNGLGLMGMRERVVAEGGTFTITSSPGSGTSVDFEVPVEN